MPDARMVSVQQAEISSAGVDGQPRGYLGLAWRAAGEPRARRARREIGPFGGRGKSMLRLLRFCEMGESADEKGKSWEREEQVTAQVRWK